MVYGTGDVPIRGHVPKDGQQICRVFHLPFVVVACSPSCSTTLNDLLTCENALLEFDN